MKKLFVLSFLIILWLLMSGVYNPMILFFGFLSVILTMFFMSRMNEKDGHTTEVNLGFFTSFKYVIWLIKEIVKSNITVVKVLLSNEISISQKFIKVPFSQRTELGQVVFANSITLTPGTVTVETEEDHFIVHTLNFEKSTDSELENMNQKVTKIEKQ